MHNSELAPTRIKYTYEMDRHARLQTAHGIWGGINPHGEIEMNFYSESDSIPDFTEQIIAPDGSFGHEILPDMDEQHSVVRHIHSRVLLNYNTARAMLEWLEDRLDELEQEKPSERYDNDSEIKQ